MFVGRQGISRLTLLCFSSIFCFSFPHVLVPLLPLVQLHLEQSKWEKLESRKRVKASLEARMGSVKSLVRSQCTSARKQQLRGGEPPPAKLSRMGLNGNL